jgi:hypothetical protein
VSTNEIIVVESKRYYHDRAVRPYNVRYRSPKMIIPLLRLALPLALVGAFGLQTARADIYTWVDASGSINVSNLAPPEGVRVTSIIRSTAPAATSDGPTKTQALEDRVRQLEDEVELSRRAAPPPVVYPPIVVPPVVQYIVQPPPVFVQYAFSEPPPASYGCDPGLLDCGLAWTPGFYPASVVVLRAPNFRHFRPAPDGRHAVAHPPMQTLPITSPAQLIQPLASPLIQPLASPLIQPLVPPSSFPTGFRKG